MRYIERNDSKIAFESEKEEIGHIYLDIHIYMYLNDETAFYSTKRIVVGKHI